MRTSSKPKAQVTATQAADKIKRVLKPFAVAKRTQILAAVNAQLALDEDAPLFSEGKVLDMPARGAEA